MLVMPYFTYFGVLRMHYFTYFEHFQCLILHVLSIFNALKKEVRSPNRTTQVAIWGTENWQFEWYGSETVPPT